MAKTISDEQMKLTMIINGNSAQKELFDLEKSTRKLNEENKALLLQKKLLEKQGKKDTDQYKLLTATIKANSAEVLTNKSRMSELQKEIGLTGLTMGQLQSKATMLRNTLRNLIPGSPDYLRYDAELTQVNNRLGELRGRAQTSRSSIASLADGFNRYQALAVTFIAGLTGVVLSIQKIIDINGKLSDAQSDVMKTTRMTKEEVDSLTKSFGLLKTRTQRIDLLGIAAVGGELNIAKGEILDFVKVMDKSGVALGDSFEGGAEEVATKLGKIKNLYQELKESGVELAFESVGSALNDLGADGNATAANVAEFVTRVGSMPEAFKPSIAVALGLGAAFEETGLNAEKSASNYSKVITIAANNIEGFARVMGKPKKQMEDLMNTNPNEFFLQFSKSIANLKPVPLAKVLDSLKLNDNEVKQVISAAGANVDLFRQKINLANQSLNEGTSLTDEYNIKNNNLAATLEKISKRVSGWFSSEGFNNWLFSMVEGFGRLIGATDDVNGAGQKWRNTLVFIAKVIAIVTAALITNVGWQKLVAIWTTRNTEATLLYTIASKARAFADGVGMIASQAFAGVMMLLRGNVVGATQAFRVMTTTMMTTPWGFILGAIAAIGTAYVLFSDEAKEAATAQSMIADNAREVDALVQKQSSSFMSLMGVVNDTTASTEARTEALIKAKQIGGEYTKGLTLENAATLQGKTMIDAYIKSLEKKAMLQVLEKRQASIMEDMDKKKNLSLEEEVAWYDKMWAQVKNLGNAGLASADLMVTASQRRKASLSDLQKQLDFTNTEMNEFLKANPEIIKTIDVNGSGDSGSIVTDNEKTETKKNPNSTQEEINRIKLENEAKYADLFLKQQRQLEDDKIAAMQDGYEKEMLIENQRYKREIDDLNRQKVNAAELAKLDEDIAKAKEAKDMSKYSALLIIRKGWDKKNQDLDTQINTIAEGKLAIHNAKLGIIQEKGAKESLQKRKEAFDQAKILRETQFNEELAKLGTNERAKEKLRKKFELTELAQQEKFLKQLLDEFNEIVGKGKFEKMDMSLLSPEQVESFTKEAAKVGLTLSELIAKKNELAGQQISNAQELGISKGATDIFGFTPENWRQFYDNIQAGKFGVDEMVFAVSALVDMWGKYNQILTANENKQLQSFEKSSDAKKTKLKKQLDNGVISQRQYEKSVAKIDSELDKKKADLSYKQAKRERGIAIASAISGTAMAVVGALGNKPWTPFNFALAGLVGAMGLLQLGTIMAQPLPAKGYESGLYNEEYVKRSQDGKTFKSKYQGKTRSGLVSETSHFLVAENGPEMVIDNKAWRQMDPAVKEALVRNLQGIKGFENGMYNTEKMRYEVPATTTAPASSANDTQLLEMVLAVVSENTAVMKDLRDKGVIGRFFKNDMQSAKNIQESINDYNDLRNSNKK